MGIGRNGEELALPAAVAAELGRFWAFGYGEATADMWLNSPHPQLTLATPVEALRAHRETEVLAALRADLQRISKAGQA